MSAVVRVLLLFLLTLAQPLLAQLSMAQGSGRKPLPVAEAPELFQRILTLPGARLSPGSGAPPGAAVLPTFSILYVYSRASVAGADWLEVGAKGRGQVDGWLPASDTQKWNTMLVMQYAPWGQRGRVVFFQDDKSLEALLGAPDSSKRGREILLGLEHKQPDPAIIAAEPTAAIDPKSQFYIMPILQAKVKYLNNDLPVRVLQVGSVTAQGSVTPPAKPPEPPPNKYRIGLVFLLDTTTSMKPYIDAVVQTVRSISDRISHGPAADRVSIGLVGYRSNISRQPRLEYVTRIFEPLDPAAPPQQVLRRLDSITQADVSTPAWDEDAFAGLHTALHDLNWTPYAAKLLVLVTDSGALPGKNPLVQFPDFDIENAVDLANALKVAVFPWHLLTPEGDRFGDRSIARRQWQRLAETGDPGGSKYTPITAGSPVIFHETLDAVANKLGDSIEQIAAGHPIERSDIRINSADSVAEQTKKQAVAAMVNELFRAQSEYLGAREGTAAPPFFRAWVSDHDLGNPRLRTLTVQVFLTRTQLSGLGESLHRIVDLAKQAALAPQDFFENLQLLSAQTAADPDRPAGTGEVTSLKASNLLPAFLKLLPYRSKVLNTTRDEWLSGGVTGQQEFIDELDYKLQRYHDIEADLGRWTALDPQDPDNAVSPVPLDVLP